MPTLIRPSDVAASAEVECITSGASTPATTPFAALPTQAWNDDAMPRRSGTRSSTSRVTTGTIMAQPNEKMRDRQQGPPRVRLEDAGPARGSATDTPP